MHKVIIFLFILFNITAAFAEDGETKNLKIFIGKWKDNCTIEASSNKKKCILERAMFIDEKLEKKMMTMLMQTNSSSEDILFTLVSPLGTLIQSGVKIGLNNELLDDKAYGFNYCIQNGCITNFLIKKKTLDMFKKSETLDVEYTLRNNQKMNISLSLEGFNDAFTKIK